MDISTAAWKAAFAFGSMLLTLVSIVALSQPAGATTTLPDFTTFRSPSRGVFLVANGHWYGVPNPQTLDTCLGGAGRVQMLSEAQVDDVLRTYPAAPAPAACRVNYANGTTLRAPSDTKVYVIFNGHKYWVTEGSSITGCLGGWGVIRHISDAELAWTNDFYPYAGTWNCPSPPPLSYPNMTTLQAPGTGVVVINNGSRFAIRTPDILERCYSGQARVRQVSTAEWNRMWTQFNDGSYAADCAPPAVPIRGERAAAWAAAEARSVRPSWSDQLGACWSGRCEQFVEIAFGTLYKFNTAYDHYRWQLANGRMHPGDTNPPRGAVVFYNAVSRGVNYGHVGISLGNGTVAATTGWLNQCTNVRIVSLTYFSGYLGWAYAPPTWPGR